MHGSVYKRCPCPKTNPDGTRARACTKAHGSWSYKFDGPGGPATGRRQVVVGGFRTRRTAEKALATAMVEGPPAAARAGTPAPPPPGPTLREYLDAWLVGMKPQLASTGWSNYERLLRLYVPPALGGLRLAELTGSMLTAHYAQLVERGGRQGRPLSPTTVRLVHRILHKALADAVDADVLAANPVAKARAPRRQRPETAVWTADQVRGFLTARRGDRLYAAWLLALTSGLRRGELAGLVWGDIDLERGTLSVARQRTTDADSHVVVKSPKGTSRRTLDLGSATSAALRAHRTTQDAELQVLGTARSGDSGVVFARPDGHPLHPQRLADLFQAAAREVGLPVIRLHDARHSCATLALSAGIHPKVVQQLLGHSSWSVTMDLYSHRIDRLQREASQRIEDLVSGA
jgi:integrase